MNRQIIKFLLFSFILSSCGAKLQKADEVQEIFANAKDLKGKILSLCNNVSQRQTEPTFNGISLASDFCKEPPGVQAINLNELTPKESLGFAAFESSNNSTDDINNAVLNINTRSEVWLNHSLIGLLQSLLPKLKEKADGSGGLLKPKDGSKQQMDIKIIGDAKIDLKKLEFYVKFNLTSTKAQNGLVDISNEFIVNAKVFEDFAAIATVQTTGDSDPKNSLLKNAKIMAVAVPHAGDVYIDIITNINLHSYGVDKIMEKEFVKMISDSLRLIPDVINDAGSN